MGLINRLRARRRRALPSLLVWIVALGGMVLFDGPVDALPGFVSFLVWNLASFDLAMIASDDNWM